MRRKAKEQEKEKVPSLASLTGERTTKRRSPKRYSDRDPEPRIYSDYNFNYSPAVKLEQLEVLLRERKISEADYFLWKRVYLHHQ